MVTFVPDFGMRGMNSWILPSFLFQIVFVETPDKTLFLNSTDGSVTAKERVPQSTSECDRWEVNTYE